MDEIERSLQTPALPNPLPQALTSKTHPTGSDGTGNGSFDVQSIGSNETFLSCFTHPTGSMADMLDQQKLQQQQNVYINPLDRLNRAPTHRPNNSSELDSRPSSSPGIGLLPSLPHPGLDGLDVRRNVATLPTSSHPDTQGYAESGSCLNTARGLRMRAYSKFLGNLKSRYLNHLIIEIESFILFF